MDGTFKIVPEWYQQMFTIHCRDRFPGSTSKDATFISAKQFCGRWIAAVVFWRDCLRVTKGLVYISGEGEELGLRTMYLHEAETQKKIKTLMATAFLPLLEISDAVDLLGRNVTGSVAALFENG
ncbi:hypothetical protein T11_15290 [Trichinella zimbabwensis]|uniref:Uncharacterized protein n=1 Tax=Trichinella zimbabwensis TaxID=268475 RepID=A0A0V1GTL1_9BILA|nr:hypothetical protein T11_15290 [Trichinella zimbabwensis]